MKFSKKADHDYNPEWDHEIDEKVEAKIAQFIKSIIQGWGPLLKKLGLGSVTVTFVTTLGKGVLAEYVDGTYSSPHFLINLQETKETAKEVGYSVEMILETSLLHELAHAWQESTGNPYDEDQAETFAWQYHDTRVISLPIKTKKKADNVLGDPVTPIQPAIDRGQR